MGCMYYIHNALRGQWGLEASIWCGNIGCKHSLPEHIMALERADTTNG
jgi:hypothetical protein